jgi:hypothetical protein
MNGLIATQVNELIENVEVTLTGADDMDLVETTDENGVFTFTNLPTEADYTLQPAHNVAVDLGTVTVADVVTIGNVILGVTSFDNPYNYLAADVDQDQSLSVGDMVSIQRVILGLDDNFASGESWGFVPTDVDVSDPFAQEFLGVYNVNNLDANVFGADFVGFAYGDVNSLGRSSASLEVEDAQLEAGQNHIMTISGAELAGFQGTLELAAGPATLTLCDAAGRVLSTQKLEATAGLNRVELTNLTAVGVITYTLTAVDLSATKKMVVIR